MKSPLFIVFIQVCTISIEVYQRKKISALNVILRNVIAGTLEGHKHVSINVFVIGKYEEIHSADDIIQEVEVMKSFSDEHILQLIGFVSQPPPLMIITEPVTGNLQRYCRNVTYLCQNDIFVILEQVLK